MRHGCNEGGYSCTSGSPSHHQVPVVTYYNSIVCKLVFALLVSTTLSFKSFVIFGLSFKLMVELDNHDV